MGLDLKVRLIMDKIDKTHYFSPRVSAFRAADEMNKLADMVRDDAQAKIYRKCADVIRALAQFVPDHKPRLTVIK